MMMMMMMMRVLPLWRRHLQERCGDDGLVQVESESAVVGLVLFCNIICEKEKRRRTCQREKGWNVVFMMCVEGPRKKGDLRIEGVAIQLTTSYCDSLQMNTLIVCNICTSAVYFQVVKTERHTRCE